MENACLCRKLMPYIGEIAALVTALILMITLFTLTFAQYLFERQLVMIERVSLGREQLDPLLFL